MLLNKPLVAVMSCEANRHRVREIRETWLKDADNIDVRFFFGTTTPFQLSLDLDTRHRDEIYLDVPDDYNSLPLKVQGALNWAIANSYTNTFKTDDDTLVIPARLLKSGYFAHDYTGRLNSGAPCEYYNPVRGWASGGPGYWLSTRAMKAVTNATWNGDWAEDRWVGNTLHAAGLSCHNDMRYTLYPFFADERTNFVTACNVMDNLRKEAITPSRVDVTLTSMYNTFVDKGFLPEIGPRQSTRGMR